MRAFAELTDRGKTNRLRLLAADVVATRYGLVDADVRLVSAHSFNTVFQVSTGRDRYAIRVGSECRIHAAGTEDVEAIWLEALREAGITAPVAVPTVDGKHWLNATDPGVPEPRTCSMFTWVDGRPLRERLTEESMTAAGALLAVLHEHAASHTRAEPIPTLLHADRAIYFHEENRVASYRSSYGELFNEATDRIQGELDRLWQSPPHRPHLLHGDFGPNNVVRWRDRLAPIDFQDLQFGFDLQDVGLSLADLGRTTPELKPAFRAGYRSVRAWPELTPDLERALAAARSLNVMNLGLHLQRSGIAGSLDDHGSRVASWMKR